MVFLKCAQCGKQNAPAFIEGEPYGILLCTGCNMLICGTCTQKTLYCPQHPYEMVDSAHMLNFCIFASYAPEDELRLIDLQIAGNYNCSTCNCSKTTLNRFGIQQVLCLKCNPSLSCWWTAWPTLLDERLFRKIIRELQETVMSKTRTHRNGVDGILPVQIAAKCKACKQDLCIALAPLMLDGEPHCKRCSQSVSASTKQCGCLSRLMNFIQCIPENQLHLLTYSKWMKAVGCEQHRDILYELIAVSADGTKAGKLRSFFKKEEIARTLNISETSSISNPTITVKTTAIAIDRKQNTSTLTKLDPSIPDKLLPDRITCSCGSEHDLSNMFDCLTCSSYGNCSLCMTKKHWGHEMNESKKTVTFCLINSQSENTRLKVAEMIRQANGSSKKGEQSFEKLCHVLGIVFKDAMLSEDLHRIQSLLTKANTSELEKYFKNAMNSTTKSMVSVRTYWKQLRKRKHHSEHLRYWLTLFGDTLNLFLKNHIQKQRMRHCKCLSVLIDLIECIPENKLHLLTYSKWMKAVGCEQHRDILYELNAVSAHGTKTGKLRSFFKNQDIDSNPDISETSSIPKPTLTEETTAIAKDRKQNTSTLSKMDPSIPDKLLPDRITCSCGCEQELSNMFDCLTCSTYGVCALCLAKQHWGHEMNESKKTVASFLINSQSEATRQKLIEMVGQTKDLNKEGEQSFEKLCEVLGVVFKDAMISEDLHRIQSLLAKANTSELEKFFKSAMNSTTKLYKCIDAFCEDLLKAVEEEKQNISLSVKEPSSTSRE